MNKAKFLKIFVNCVINFLMFKIKNIIQISGKNNNDNSYGKM